MSEKSSVVVSDLHGHADKLREVINWYGEDMHYVINGDVIDRGPDSCETLTIIRDLDADLVLGNHEWTLLAALQDEDSERRWGWLQAWLSHRGSTRGYEDNMLESYGLTRRSNEYETAHYCVDKLRTLGHLALLQNGNMYYEDNTLLVVHAGLSTQISWARQKQQLDAIKSESVSRIFKDEPAQITSYDYATTWERPKDVHTTLVTGHYHSRVGSPEEREFPAQTIPPARVQLASHLAQGDPLFAYESWSGKIMKF